MTSRTDALRAGDGNRVLGRLSARERRGFTERCTTVELEFGQILAEPDQRIRYVYFPLVACISLNAPAGAGSTLEVAMIGNEGVLGATIAQSVDSAPLQALVQHAGSARRITAVAFRSALERSPALRTATLRYGYLLLRQVAQTAACTRYHPIEARLARWLLMTQDRVDGGAFRLTQAYLGRMLGVRRVGVTKAARALQSRRLIGYHRGTIVVVNRRGLEEASCRCYADEARLYPRILG